MSTPERTRLTARDFFARPETGRLEELIDGELIVSPTPLIQHQRLVLRLAKLVEAAQAGGEVLIAPTAVHLDDVTVLEPDVLWLAAQSHARLTDHAVVGPPELVAEVISPSSRTRDKKTKFRLYERFSVAEYWIADPEAELLEVFTLRDDAYALVGVFDAADTFQSPVLGSIVSLNAVFGKLKP
jgi:Uma2 family endonuclease